MKLARIILLILSVIELGGIAAAISQSAAHRPIRLKLADTDYVHRWSKDNQHEFTPQGQGDLQHWSDMVTINYYPSTKDGDGLAANANAVLENYKDHHAVIVKTSSVPRTASKEAEHFVTAVFQRPDFTEVVFTRFKMIHGLGASLVYSHREYGKTTGSRAGEWLQKNGPSTEKALMGLETVPTPDELAKQG